MNTTEKDTTSASVPAGEYARRREIEFAEVPPTGTGGDINLLDRQLTIEADENTPPTCRFLIDIKAEEERRLFTVINRRLKKLRL